MSPGVSRRFPLEYRGELSWNLVEILFGISPPPMNLVKISPGFSWRFALKSHEGSLNISETTLKPLETPMKQL